MTGAGPEATGTPQQSGETADGPAVETDEAPTRAVDATRFAHASEAEMARILDFYAVRWEYEPTTFPILWNLDGEVVESFAPDFYLPELEVFLEMTTLKQRLVRKKNRKLRRLRELYPDVRIKLFYARDFRAMLLKYGRFALMDSLSGTPGQVLPERVIADAAGTAVEPIADPLPLPLAQVPRSSTQADVPVEPPDAIPAPSARSTPSLLTRATPRSRPGRRQRRAAAAPSRSVAEQEAGA